MKHAKTILLFLALSLIVSASLAGEKGTVIKLGHPKGVNTPINRACEWIAKEVAEKTGGALTVEVFPAGQLGFERDLVEGLTQGTVDMAWSSTALVGNFEEPLALFSLPYVFRDYDHVHKTVAGEIGQTILDNLRKNQGIRALAFHDQGFRHVWNNQKPIFTVDDIKGMKLRGPESPIYLDTFRLLGVNITPISWGETYTAIQTGVVVGLEQPMEEIVASKYYEIVKYGSFSRHMFAGGLLMIREDLFQSLPEDQRKILVDACKESEVFNNNAVTEYEKKYIEELRSKGMELNDIADKEMEKFAEAMKPLYQKYASKLGGDDIVDRVRAIR